MSLAIETTDLRKRYGARDVVDGLNLQVRRGEVFGFLGPNGAGKSTTVKMLLGLVRPSSGTVRVLGGSVEDPRVRRQVGFLPEQFRFHTWMRGNEFLRFHGRLAGLSDRELRTRIPEALALVGLAGRGQDVLSGYSKGMLQRAGLAQALIHEPGVVFLDEPTSALDPIGRMEVRSVIRELRARNVTVFLNSHLLTEVEQTCDRVAFVNAGRVLRAGTLQEVLGPALRARLRADPLTPALLARLRQIGSVHEEPPGPVPGVLVDLNSEADLPRLSRAVHDEGAVLYELTPVRPDLESLFVQLVQGKNRGEA